jgi:fermentation-respiration switch protein FrsA (DUF1100 family)
MNLRSRLIRPHVLVPAILALAAVYFLLSFAMVWSATRGERFPFEDSPADFGLQYEEVSFPSRGHDLQLNGWLIRGDPDSPYLIFVHGIGGQRTSDGAVPLAASLVDDGYNVLLFDLRAHGTSPGNVVSGGYFERDDVLGAYDFAVSQGAEPGYIALVGRSMGAAASIMAATQEPGISAIVSDSSYANVDDLISHETARRTPFPREIVPVFLPGARLLAGAVYGIDLGDLTPARDVRKLKFPILLIHGEADQRVPVSHSWAIYKSAPPGSEIWTLPGVDHVDAYRTEPEAYVAHVESYLRSRFSDVPAALAP